MNIHSGRFAKYFTALAVGLGGALYAAGCFTYLNLIDDSPKAMRTCMKGDIAGLLVMTTGCAGSRVIMDMSGQPQSIQLGPVKIDTCCPSGMQPQPR